MKTEIIKIKGGWQEVVNDCRATVGKSFCGDEPSADWKRRILIAEHSPIRDIIIKWRWPSIKSWIATHWSRHKWECFIQTQRSDRTGVNRDELPQSSLVSFVGEANVQALIDTMRKRLCYQAAPETREYAEDLKVAIRKVDTDIAWALTPACVFRGGCPEMKSCGYYEKFIRYHNEFAERDIQERYNAYNREFFRKRSLK